jgi:hypothetical protein
VTADDALHIAQDSAWRLLLELVAGDGRASEHHPVESIIEIVGELGLQPAETERIGTLVSEAVRKAAQRGERDQQASPVSIDPAWTLGKSAGRSAGAGDSTCSRGRRITHKRRPGNHTISLNCAYTRRDRTRRQIHEPRRCFCWRGMISIDAAAPERGGRKPQSGSSTILHAPRRVGLSQRRRISRCASGDRREGPQ